jgi:hypothetical protein
MAEPAPSTLIERPLMMSSAITIKQIAAAANRLTAAEVISIKVVNAP